MLLRGISKVKSAFGNINFVVVGNGILVHCKFKCAGNNIVHRVKECYCNTIIGGYVEIAIVSFATCTPKLCTCSYSNLTITIFARLEKSGRENN